MANFKKVSLLKNSDSGIERSSLPLVLPNNVKYDLKTGSLTRNPTAKRTHLELVPSTVALLSKVQDPLAVVSIAGLARSGKSYILSRFLGSSDAFQLGHTMNPETYGIWIGTEVLQRDDFTIILVDTEGIDAASAEKKNDISLLVLTILISSYFIFNTISVPKQADLEELQCFVQLANGLRVSREGSGDYKKFSKVFPDFLWLLRDVILTPTDKEGNEIDAKTFLLDRVLAPSEDLELKPSDKVARALKTFFPSIDCLTLPPPSDDANVVRNITSNEDKLTPQFKKAVPRVIEHIFSRVKPKIGYHADSHITGAHLVGMLKTYVTAVNDPSAIPVVETSWQTSLRMLAERFHNEALKIYKEGMTIALAERGDEPLEAGGDGTTLVSLHRKFYGAGQEHLRTGLGPMCNEAEQTKFLSCFQQVVFGAKGEKTGTDNQSGLFHEYWRINNEKSVKYCEKLRDDLWKKIANKIAKGDSGYTYDHLKEDLKRFEMEYRANAKGPAKEKVYGNFLEFMKSEEKTFAKLQDYKEEEHVEKQKSAEIESKLADLHEEQRRVEAMMLEEMEEHKQQAIKMSQEYNERMDRMQDEEKNAYLERMREQAESMQQRMTENVQTLQEMSAKNMEFLEANMKHVREDSARQHQQMIEVVQKVQEKNARLAREMAEQAKKRRKGPLEALLDIVPVVSSFANIFGLFGKGAPTKTAKT